MCLLSARQYPADRRRDATGSAQRVGDIIREILINFRVHGSAATVNRICDHPAIKAISFVGGDNAGKHIYHRATALGKRVQANLGAKNHCVIMPDGIFCINSFPSAHIVQRTRI